MWIFFNISIVLVLKFLNSWEVTFNICFPSLRFGFGRTVLWKVCSDNLEALLTYWLVYLGHSYYICYLIQRVRDSFTIKTSVPPPGDNELPIPSVDGSPLHLVSFCLSHVITISRSFGQYKRCIMYVLVLIRKSSDINIWCDFAILKLLTFTISHVKFSILMKGISYRTYVFNNYLWASLCCISRHVLFHDGGRKLECYLRKLLC